MARGNVPIPALLESCPAKAWLSAPVADTASRQGLHIAWDNQGGSTRSFGQREYSCEAIAFSDRRSKLALKLDVELHPACQ
jgi:hypothetical protein